MRWSKQNLRRTETIVENPNSQKKALDRRAQTRQILKGKIGSLADYRIGNVWRTYEEPMDHAVSSSIF